MNQDQTPVSIMPHGRKRNRDKRHGIELAPIPNVSPPNVVLPDHRGADTIGERVRGKPVAAHAAMPARTVDSGSPGGPVPKGLNRAKK
jgi:hypothetical protein